MSLCLCARTLGFGSMRSQKRSIGEKIIIKDMQRIYGILKSHVVLTYEIESAVYCVVDDPSIISTDCIRETN